MAASDVLPVFRSDAQRKLMAYLFVNGQGGESSLTKLSQELDLPISSVQREVQLLDAAGIVASRRVGNMRLVRANEESPLYRDLRALLIKAYGPAATIVSELSAIAGIERAYIFGSWARRYAGEPGPPPNDIDLLIVGEPDLESVYRAARNAESTLAVDVNPIVVTPEEFEDPTGLVKRVRANELLPLEIQPDA